MNDFCAKMEAGKARAVTARNRGISTGKAAKGHIRRRRGAPVTSPEREAIEAGIRAKLEADLAKEDALRAQYPERYEFFV